MYLINVIAFEIASVINPDRMSLMYVLMSD